MFVDGAVHPQRLPAAKVATLPFADFGYGLTGGYPGFGPFAMVPPQWLDAAYMSYAWPEYFRRPTSTDLCKLPIPPCSSITKGECPCMCGELKLPIIDPFRTFT